jgi:hypothetical protein
MEETTYGSRTQTQPFLAEAVKRELRGQILDEYLADYERRKSPISEQEQNRARQIFDEVFTEGATSGS